VELTGLGVLEVWDNDAGRLVRVVGIAAPLVMDDVGLAEEGTADKDDARVPDGIVGTLTGMVRVGKRPGAVLDSTAVDEVLLVGVGSGRMEPTIGMDDRRGSSPSVGELLGVDAEGEVEVESGWDEIIVDAPTVMPGDEEEAVDDGPG
jgi:hypothetical protein